MISEYRVKSLNSFPSHDISNPINDVADNEINHHEPQPIL